MGIITLKDLKFKAFHGVFEEEKVNGNTFIVDVKIKVDTSKAEKTDNINDTLDYVEVYRRVSVEMDIPSDLLENVASRINKSIAEMLVKGKIKTTIYKQKPPIGGACAYTSVTLKQKVG